MEPLTVEIALLLSVRISLLPSAVGISLLVHVGAALLLIHVGVPLLLIHVGISLLLIHIGISLLLIHIGISLLLIHIRISLLLIHIGISLLLIHIRISLLLIHMRTALLPIHSHSTVFILGSSRLRTAFHTIAGLSIDQWFPASGTKLSHLFLPFSHVFRYLKLYSIPQQSQVKILFLLSKRTPSGRTARQRPEIFFLISLIAVYFINGNSRRGIYKITALGHHLKRNRHGRNFHRKIK